MSSSVVVDDDNGDDHSACSSVGTPPFALLASTESPKSKNMFSSPYQSQQQQGSVKLYPSIMKRSLLSPAAQSSTTAETEKTAQESSYSESFTRDSHYELTSPTDLFQESHTIEFHAVASLLTSTSLQSLESSEIPDTPTFHLQPRYNHSTTRSMRFSELMREADDKSQYLSTPRMSPWLENSQHQSNSSFMTQQVTNQSSLPQSPGSKPLERSRLQSRKIQIDPVDEEIFQVTMQVEATRQNSLHVLGNPGLLPMWCESVQALVITRTSEGAATTTARGHREYDGEWVEASTSTLVSPTKGGYVASSLQSLRAYMGFPSWGKISMFLERQRGQVSLSIGPFAGGLTAFHRLEVTDYQGVTSITDRVRVGKETSSSPSSVCYCGLLKAMQLCFQPNIDGHMEQAFASMTKLRVLLEHGERVNGNGIPIMEGEEIDGVSIQALLLN